MNVFSLFENAVAAWGDRTAVRCGARRQTYRELDAAAAAFAGHLASLGLAPGDRVAVFMQNGLLYPAVLMGAFRGGYVAVPSTLSCIRAKLATSSRTPPPKPLSSTPTRWRAWRPRRRLSGPATLSSRGRLRRPAISKLCFGPRPQTPALRRSAIPTIRPGCSTLRARPDDQKALCSATAISSRWR